MSARALASVYWAMGTMKFEHIKITSNFRELLFMHLQERSNEFNEQGNHLRITLFSSSFIAN